jgi:hypothetical protein
MKRAARMNSSNPGETDLLVVETSVGTRSRRRAKVGRLAAFILAVQFVVFLVLTLTGWGSSSSRNATPPRMEQLGAPPGLIPTYVGLTHITFDLQDSAARTRGIAVFAGTNSSWGGTEPRLPSVTDFGEVAEKTLQGTLGETTNTLLFVIPSRPLTHGPLYVAIRGDRYRLHVVEEDQTRGFAVSTATVENHLLSYVGSSLLWMTSPAPRSISVPLMVIARGPNADSFSLAGGFIARGTRRGRVMVGLHGAEIGAPVIAVSPSQAALAGFAEEGGAKSTRFIPTTVVARRLRAAASSMPSGG